MNTQSCDCRLVAGPDEYYRPGDNDEDLHLARAGEFFFLPHDPSNPTIEPEYIVLRRPDGSNGGAIPIKRGPNQSGAAWGWDGDREKPTLTPSIWWKSGDAREWHGWLRAGRLVSC
jgi:hypothetical protein